MEFPPLSRIQGSQIGSSLYHLNDGFFFVKSSQNGSTVYFRCSKWRGGCCVTAILGAGSFLRSFVHNHAPDPFYVALKMERQSILNEASNLDQAPLADIFENSRVRFSDVFTPHSLQPAMMRTKLNALPVEPTTLYELDSVLQDERYRCISATSGFEDSVYCGSTLASDDSLVILLLTRECREFFKLSVTLFSFTTPFAMEGSPHHYVIHVICTIWDNTFIILAWFLMERMSEQSFTAAFSYLKQVLGRTHFKTIVCQHGSLESTAYKVALAPVTVTFCLQDFVQCVYNYIRSELPNHDSHLIDFACLVCALPILPSDVLHIGLTVLRQEIMRFPDVQEQANILLGYVESSWIHVLNDFSVSGDHYRTSNIKETVQRKVNQILDTHKNNIYCLIGGIARIAEVSKRDIQDIKIAKRISQRRGVLSLSTEREIVMLTRTLIHPFGSQLTAVRNLLNAASLRIKHLLL